MRDEQTNKQTITEDRATQPMEAGGRVSQNENASNHLKSQWTQFDLQVDFRLTMSIKKLYVIQLSCVLYHHDTFEMMKKKQFKRTF